MNPETAFDFNKIFQPIEFELTQILDTKSQREVATEPQDPKTDKTLENYIKLVNKPKIPTKIGLQNLGNTCFINSVLQALLNIKGYQNMIEELTQKISFEKDALNFSLLHFLKSFIRILKKNKLRVIEPKSLNENVSIFNKRFKKGNFLILSKRKSERCSSFSAIFSNKTKRRS